MPTPSRRNIHYFVLTAFFAVTSLIAMPSKSDTVMAPPWTVESKNRQFEVTLEPQDGEIRINSLQKWIATVKDANGQHLDSAFVQIDGGMRGHGHGLPTQPMVVGNLGGGRYLIEGLRFNMVGAWTLLIAVDTASGGDTAIFDFEINY